MMKNCCKQNHSANGSVKALILLWFAYTALTGCATPWFQDPHLDIAYTRAAQTGSPDRNPVVVIPGLLGTSLKDRNTGEYLWGGFDGLSGNPRNPDVDE